MATQAGIIIEGANQPHKVVDNISRPSPEGRQVLVKCLAVGLNPIEALQHHTGMMVNEWPAILGSDGAGVVIEVGPDVARLKVGDYVYSCAPVGQNRFTPFQDAYLAREDLLFKRGNNISLEDSCTIGTCLLTSSLCLLGGAGLELPDDGNKAQEKDEWIVVLGGSGNVGQFAIQLGKVCGYKVLASCSPSKQSIAIRNGASATFDSRETIDAQVADIKKITHGNFGKMMDASTYGYKVMVKALETASDAKEKYLTSVDSWADLGHLCRPNEKDGSQITSNIANWIPLLEKHIAAGTLKPLEHYVVDGVGWEKVIQGIQDMEGGKIGKKIVHLRRRHIETTMEAIGAGASTLAFVLLALKSAKIINESLSSIKDAPRIVSELSKDLESLQSVLGRISGSALQHAPTSTIESLNDILQACTTELSSIECRLAKFSTSSGSSRSSRLYKGVLAYVKKEDLENARSRIRDKSTQINLYLSLLQAQSLLQVSSRIDTHATATASILEQILGEVSKLHWRLDQDAAASEVEQLPTTADDDATDSAMAGRLGAMALCSELESSISRLSTLIDHDGLALDADDAEQIIDDLRRFVVIAKERSIEKSRLSSNSTSYGSITEDDAKALGRDLKLIEGLILSAPIVAINQSASSSRKLRSHLPHGTIIKQKRIREEIDIDHGYLTISTNKRRRICTGSPSDSFGSVNTFRDVVANIVFRPSNSPWMISVSLSQGQLFDRSIQSIPRISVCRIVPNDSPVFTLVKQGSLKEFIAMLQEGKASLRDHDEQGMPLLHYAATASVEMCKFLIESGADVDEMGEHTGTALSRIAGLDRHDTTLVLLENMADPTLSYPGWDNPLSTACNLDLPSAELFLKHGGHFTMHDLESFDLNGRTRLHQVCMAESRATSKKKAVAMLAAAGANLNACVAKSWSPDDHQTLGFTCLHSLVYKAHRSRDRDELEAVVFLIQQGADILAVDHHQHSVSMRAYLPNDGDNQYSSKGSYRGDLWDAALTICGYDINPHRDAYPRVPRYNRIYRRKDFEKLWEGYEALCPYWTDERYPETGGDDDYWKQPVRRCEHIACSDCEELPPQTDEIDVEPRIDADIPVYAQAIYREWYLARSPESNPSHMPYIDHISNHYDEDDDGEEESPSPGLFEGGGRESSVDEGSDGGVQFYDEMNSISPPSSEDGEAAYDRLVGSYQDGEREIDDYPSFVDRWLEHYIRAAEEEYEGEDEDIHGLLIE
ncbi:hypothetical protein FACUT_6303 [Fusarium acutatum]|uniref:Enoyl reductase (ER) domain-containing protein n=1 Tax=Fusarium acutatum TaxID=78861 RepID=A0A8H4JTB8_9HYPO|nr:hypothetical protein FACUT_6303 [Fusarium acutatum]